MPVTNITKMKMEHDDRLQSQIKLGRGTLDDEFVNTHNLH